MNEQDSKKQILKSTGILGSAQVFLIIISMMRVKAIALLLGPVGVGIAGLYQVAFDFIKSITGLGLNNSVVRYIATADQQSEKENVSKIITTLKRWTYITGLFGMVVTIIFCRQISFLTFGNYDHAWSIALLSMGIFMSTVAAGYLAILQGLRRLKEIAKANVIGSILGLIGSVTLFYFFGFKGIVPAIILTAITSLIMSGFYSSKLPLEKINVSSRYTYEQGLQMIKFSFFLMISGLASIGTMYLTRGYIVKQSNLEAVGFFVSAWSISSLYISAIFGAMGSDFFPRLSGLQNDHAQMRKLVNEQTEIAILLSAPIIIGMISFTPLLINILYSKEFGYTSKILEWQLMGDYFKVLSWPLGFIFLAKGKGVHFLLIELLWNFIYLLGVMIGWRYYSLEITGIVFLVAYLILLFIYYIVVNKMIAFNWSAKLLKNNLFFIPLLICAFLNAKLVSGISNYLLGVFFTILAGVYSLFTLKKLWGFRF